MMPNPAVLLAELSELVKTTVTASPGRTVRDRITMAAETLRLPRRRVEDWWYVEVCRVEAFEADTIRRWALQARYHEIARLERELEKLRLEMARAAPIRPAALPDRAVRGTPRRRGLQTA